MTTTATTNSDAMEISADPSKYVTLPVQHEKIWELYQTTLEKFWTVYDVYVVDDRESIKANFTEEQSQYILQLLTFMFATHYTTINKELFMQFMSQVDIKEAAYYFGSQADSKKTHSMMYSMLLDELVQSDQEKKDKLISDVVGLPQVRDFIKWSIQNTTSSTRSFAQRLLAFATLQGIVYPVCFVLFSYLHNQNPSMMPGLVNSNRLIWRDEKLNLKFSCMLFEYIEDELTEDDARKIVGEAVSHTLNLFTKAMPVSILGMEGALMKQFIEHSADKILTDIRFSKLYNVESPFDWVEEPECENSNKFKATNNSVLVNSFEAAEFSIGDDF